jgi:EAL domain-containing protein (putative c-di-GMP-specific phosphodiesterase class I)/GGDEF domain-containing protein
LKVALRTSWHAALRLMPRGVSARAVTCAVIASLSPLLALFYMSASPDGPRALAAAALAMTLISLFGLVRTLKPIAAIGALLEDHARKPRTPGRVADDHREIIANFQTITAQLEALNKQAKRHPVTDLPLREAFLEAVTQDLAFAAAPSLLGLIRVANFDRLTAFDVTAGERLIGIVAQRLRDALGEGRPVAQVDRDCFAVWFGVGSEPNAAQAKLEAIAYVLMRDVRDAKITMTPDIQLGSAHYPIDAEEPGNLLNRAFVSLARPQRTTDGAIAFFERPSPQQAKRRFSLEQNLRHAVRRGELTLHYQPFVDLAMGRVSGAEALMRWVHPHDGAVSPVQIVPILEETGLIHEIGLWTLNTACRDLRLWSEVGQGDLKIAINLSAHQLRDSALASALCRTVTSHGLKPSQIELELTETAAMEDAVRTQAVFEKLREAGFSLAIDDFGSGYSSLSYLRRWPFQKLKIDREFVSHVDQRADSRTICKALIDLTAGLELAVLAEGVERLEEVETLHALGCPTFQGYYFSRPLPAGDFIATISNPNWLARTSSRVHRQQEELRRRLS